MGRGVDTSSPIYWHHFRMCWKWHQHINTPFHSAVGPQSGWDHSGTGTGRGSCHPPICFTWNCTGGHYLLIYSTEWCRDPGANPGMLSWIVWPLNDGGGGPSPMGKLTCSSSKAFIAGRDLGQGEFPIVYSSCNSLKLPTLQIWMTEYFINWMTLLT